MRLLIVLFTLCYLATPAVAAEKAKMKKDSHEMTALKPDEFKWGPAPSSLPPGAEAAVIQGDPGKKGLFTIRLKAPAGYKVPVHSHSADEIVTVISGTFNLGMAEKLDPAKSVAYPAGSFVNIPKKHHHFAIFNEDTVIQIHGEGPFAVTYIDPTDDPRKKMGMKQ